MKNKEIYLNEEEQAYLQSITTKGAHNLYELTRAKVLLLLNQTENSDYGRYKRTAECVGISVQAVYNMRDEFLENHNIEAYLTRKKRNTPPVKPKVDGKLEAEIIALACSKPPEGYTRWTVRLLAQEAVSLHLVDELSHMTVQRLLKKRNINLAKEDVVYTT